MLRNTLTIAILATTAALAGCSSDPGSIMGPVPTLDASASSPTLVKSFPIGPEGGEVSDGVASVSVPAGALVRSAQVTMQSRMLPDGSITCSLGPEGTRLSLEAVLSMPIPSGLPAGATCHIMVWDPGQGSWVDLGGTERGGRISTRIIQFARYELEVAD